MYFCSRRAYQIENMVNIKNLKKFIMQQFVDFKYRIWWYHDWIFFNATNFCVALYYYMSTLYMYSNWNYPNLPGKICSIEKNPIMISSYSIFEVDKLLHDEFAIIFKLAYKCHNRPRVTIFIHKCYKMHCGVRLHGQNVCYVIFWNIAPKH
jgi:hypothetical protein